MANGQYSRDLRERAVAAFGAGSSPVEIARILGASRRSVSRWITWARERETLDNQPRTGRPAKIALSEMPDLAAQVEAHPEATLTEHCQRWAARTGVRVSTATMSRKLATLGWTLKKRPSSPGSKTRRSARPSGTGWRQLPPSS